MRKLFATLVILLTSLSHSGFCLDPFPDTAPVEFSFTETYKDVIVPDPDFPSENITEGRNTVDIKGSAPLALTAEGLEDIDEFTDFEIDVGDFNYFGSLGDDENFDSFRGDRSVRIPVEGFDYDGNDIFVGSISVSWSTSKVIFSANIRNQPDDYYIASIDYYPYEEEPAIDRDDLLASFTFGDFCFDTRTVYMTGYATASEVEKDGELWDVSDVFLEGSIDSTAPTITFTEPAPNVTIVTTNQVVDEKYTITGSAADTRKIGNATFPGRVIGVAVQFGPLDNPGPFVDAIFDENTGNWSLPNAPIEAGKNKLVVRAQDEHGNYGFSTSRTITYSSKGDLTVTAEAAGFGSESNGNVVGTVSGSELAGTANQFDVIAGVPPPVNSRGQVESGQVFRVVATPKGDAVFDGWTGTIGGVVRLTSVSQVLDFETKPNLILTARFVPNPFGNVAGVYHGLATGTTAESRGPFQIKIKDSGSFSGKISVGAVTLNLKGIVLGGGHWQTTIVKGGKTYTVAFDLDVSESGDRMLTGTVTADGVNATFEADLQSWRKPKKSDPGNTADAYVGTYNVVMTPDGDNTDPNFPVGIGFGRVKISRLGGVAFVGKAGDGSAAKSASILVKRDSELAFFNLFVPLDKKTGNLAGRITVDPTQPESDLAGTIQWGEPTTNGVEPDPFSGEVNVSGSLYQKPLPGALIMLQAQAGNGRLQLFGPAYSKPTNTASLIPIVILLNPAVLSSSNTIGPAGQDNVKLKFSTNTGLFTGSYKDPDLKKNVSVSGAVVQKMNSGAGFGGGVFVRGNSAGRVTFGPVLP